MWDIDYVIQGHRYNIYEDVGCAPAMYPTVEWLVLLNALPLYTGIFTTIYASTYLVCFKYLTNADLTYSFGYS